MRTRASILVGRDGELRMLDRALKAARGGHGCAMFVTGEGGIGKSRLAAEAESRGYATGMRLLRGRGSTIGPMVPFRPLAEALLSLRRSGELPEADELGPYLPVLGRLVPDWSRDSGAPDTDSLVILAEAVIRLTGVVGRDRGCLLVLDDLQDADAETLAVVEYLVDNLDRQPTVLLGTLRSGSSAAAELVRSAVQRRAGTVIELDRLGRDEVARLAASCLDAQPPEVPEAVVERLWSDSAGNPFVVEELLSAMVGGGLLVPSPDGWSVVGELRGEMPSTLARSVVRRADQLGVQGRRLLSTAAVLGRRFPLAVVQVATGLDGRSLLSHLRAGLDAQLVASDEQAPDWYAFQHPLTAEALLAELTPVDRAELAGQVADAIETVHSGLPGEWCQMVATLREDAGDRAAAGRRFAEAGRRAIAAGAATSAVTLLDRARGLLAGGSDPELLADVVESLLHALTEAGLIERALDIAQSLDDTGGVPLDGLRRAALHTRVAWAAYVAGRMTESLAEIRTARAVLGPDAAEVDLAPVDVVDAYLALEQPGRDRDRVAEDLARRAATVAEAAPLPVVACQAWLLVGVLVRPRDIDASTACFERAGRIARQHQIGGWRIHALVRLGGNDALVDADLTRLGQARDEAVRAGAVTATLDAEANLAMQRVLRGEYGPAAAGIERHRGTARRLNLIDLGQYLAVTQAVLAAHRGRRAEMDTALVEFESWHGWRSQHVPLVLGLARTFCALLEEDRERAGVELAEAYERQAENPTIFYLTGQYGLRLLLGALDGSAGWPQYDEVTSAQASRLRWNRQFVLFARAVLLGRAGRPAEAAVAVDEAVQVAAPYAMTRFLGRRLIAEAALADGWGEPVTWLREAEEHFHGAGIPAVAAACRALLRRAGAPVPQHRDGTGAIPVRLRSLGVTIREYEVLQLLVERPSNRRIADRLHISPRTAEKHVASLITKTGQPGRNALCDAAKSLLAG